MDSACIYKVGSFFLVEAVQIWNVLEVVCIEIAALYNFVWLYIIIKYRYLKAAKTTDVPTVPSTNAPVSAAAINFFIIKFLLIF